MARTNKTQIGSSGESNDRMMRAAESGAAAKQHAHDQYLAQQRHGSAQALQQGQAAASQYAEGRQLQQRDTQLDQGQQQIDLEAAKSGFQRQGAGTDRMAKLKQEMDQGGSLGAGQEGPPTPEQQRRAEQMGKPIEQSGSAFVPTEQGMAEQRRKSFSADTDRMRAESYQQQVQQSLLKAQATNDQEAIKNIKTNLMKPMESDANMLSEFVNGKANDSTWEKLSKMVEGNPDQALQQEVQSRVAGPRVRDILNQKIASSALKYISTTDGDLPDSKVVDYTNPHMVKFTNEVREVGAMISQMSQQTGGQFTQFLGLKNLNDKIRFQNALAARSVLGGLTGFSPNQQDNPFANTPPSAGTPQGPQGPSSLEPVQDEQPQGPPPTMAESPKAPRGQNPTYTQMRRSGL
jgi:hypothetical protein